MQAVAGASNAELLQTSLEPGSPEAKLASQIQKTGEHGAELVRHLLGFARCGRIHMSRVNLHTTVDEVLALLRHSVDKRIQVVTRSEASKPWVKGDPAQIQNALLNLGVNARDAMPSGGELTILTRNEPYDGREGIVIEVRDTGQSIPPELQGRIFEPFFTTKKTGRGTGLGLAGVYGCVQSHGGDIQVDSTIGRGSVFRIRLPVTETPFAPTQVGPGKLNRFTHKGWPWSWTTRRWFVRCNPAVWPSWVSRSSRPAMCTRRWPGRKNEPASWTWCAST